MPDPDTIWNYGKRYKLRKKKDENNKVMLINIIRGNYWVSVECIPVSDPD